MPNLVLSHEDRKVLVGLIDKSVEEDRLDGLELSQMLTIRKLLIERPNCPGKCCS